MGIVKSPKFDILFSVSEDGLFKYTEIKAPYMAGSMQPGKSALKFLKYDSIKELLIIADGEGFVHIYSAQNVLYNFIILI
jgi:hypothetical protein